ncbi:conserved hypothetical protein [Ricinus communis]|uniref:Uncharacterized protein n=1 Tax=Ricinus communis TaxID=3988 RepID=B9RL76_RICCO|nr:conserved hypothetical protein [Ricinus communis]
MRGCPSRSKEAEVTDKRKRSTKEGRKKVRNRTMLPIGLLLATIVELILLMQA